MLLQMILEMKMNVIENYIKDGNYVFVDDIRN